MKKISITESNVNFYSRIAKDWMLVTAGNKERGFNTMTASWGHVGSLWANGGGLPTAIVYLRPQRYTKEFMDREGMFTLSFFPNEYKKALGYLGSHSGRDEDKVAKTNLTPVFGADYTYFKEANLVLVCRKLYSAPLLESGFVDKSIADAMYPDKDFHEMYIGEITEILTTEN